MPISIQVIRNAAIAATIAYASTFGTLYAGARDYEFQPLTTELSVGPEAELAVKLIDKRTGKPVDNASIYSVRLDMAPDGMEMMKSTLDPMPSDEIGVFRFKLNLRMAGGWRFLIHAKIPGEDDIAKGEIILKATK